MTRPDRRPLLGALFLAVALLPGAAGAITQTVASVDIFTESDPPGLGDPGVFGTQRNPVVFGDPYVPGDPVEVDLSYVRDYAPAGLTTVFTASGHAIAVDTQLGAAATLELTDYDPLHATVGANAFFQASATASYDDVLTAVSVFSVPIVFSPVFHVTGTIQGFGAIASISLTQQRRIAGPPGNLFDTFYERRSPVAGFLQNIDEMVVGPLLPADEGPLQLSYRLRARVEVDGSGGLGGASGIAGSALFDATAELVGFRAFADEAGTVPLTSGFEILGSGGQAQTIVPEPRAALLLAAAACFSLAAAKRGAI